MHDNRVDDGHSCEAQGAPPVVLQLQVSKRSGTDVHK
jgi:hypothetical protein